MVVDFLAEESFWIEWEDKFEDDSDSYITPQNPMVVEASNRATTGRTGDSRSIAKMAWQYVYDNTEYKLSEKWKRPEATLLDKEGDCEDFAFLIASMLPNMGVEESKLVIGDMVYPDGTEQLHVWNVIDGFAVDATGSMDSARRVEYKPRSKYTIVAE